MIHNLDDVVNDERKSIELLIGLDLSFNSTGITFITADEGNGKTAEFHRLVYETKPKEIKNINQHTYVLPHNISLDEVVDETDFYSEDQAFITLKMMICTKRIVKLIIDKLQRIKEIYPDRKQRMYINIEGFIMPNLASTSQLRVLGGLIMLQGQIRSKLIELNLAYKFDDFKIYITSPSELKRYFTGNGEADKLLMLKSFIDNFDGAKLLPETTSLAKVNDVIDSFALVVNCYHRVYFGNDEFMERKKLEKITKLQKKKELKARKRAQKKKEEPSKETNLPIII